MHCSPLLASSSPQRVIPANAGIHCTHAAPADLATLQAGDRAHRFEASAIYLDAADRPLGARFVHRPTGFQLDLLHIESVPQSFTWVKSFATSEQGEPHTQEHLLLRGTCGRTLATKESMSLVTSSAYTETWRTSYFFNTSAGITTFFDIYAELQRAMLHPDYSDAEIKLEVRNVGVTKNADGSLRLEEKGTVYNEMVASMANGSWQAWRAQNHAVYGTHHPLGYNQGGEPAGIRTMTPQDIRRFHAASHHLANMGTVAAFPKSAALDGLLERFDRVLMKDAPVGRAPRPADTLDKMPKPVGDPDAPPPAEGGRRAHVPRHVAGDARRARCADRVVRGAAGRHCLRPEPAQRRTAHRHALAPARCGHGTGARGPACAEQAGRRDHHFGALGALR